MDDIDYEQLEQESRLFPWLDDPSQEPEDYEWDHEEERWGFALVGIFSHQASAVGCM